MSILETLTRPNDERVDLGVPSDEKKGMFLLVVVLFFCGAAETVVGEVSLIVRFSRYAWVSSLYEKIGRGLGPEGRLWTRQARQHVASVRYPTDFVVISVVVEDALSAVKSLPGVIDVSIQRSTAARRPLSSSSSWNRNASDLEWKKKRAADVRKYGGVVAPGLEASRLWSLGFDGSNASVAIFDTGCAGVDAVETINWTSEPTLEDRLGHGTFVASLVAGKSSECPGFAPGARLHVHRVFTNDQVSFTAWFLDAFNYVMFQKQVDIINLSVGGPDATDQPFVDKIRQVVASGIAVVSAIGNDGPAAGTLNSPADMPEVVGVGGTELATGGRIASFSSRGPTWRHFLYKPDVVAPAAGVLGAVLKQTQCRAMHGTSVASPSVAGAAALVASAAATSSSSRQRRRTRLSQQRRGTFNPAMLKQCLVETAIPLPETPLYAQGAGKMNVEAAVFCALSYTPRVTAFPASLNLDECPLFEPHCEQPLFFGGVPARTALTILNGIGVAFRIVRLNFKSDDDLLSVQTDVDMTKIYWPWVGTIQLSAVSLTRNILEPRTVKGRLTVEIETLERQQHHHHHRRHQSSSTKNTPFLDHTREVSIPISVRAGPAPPRASRLLWDASRSIAYPPAFAARDSLRQQTDLLDWYGDSPYTNFKSLFKRLRSQGYYVDVYTQDATCFDASDYAALLVVDPEDVFESHELDKLADDVENKGLALFVVADWHSPELLKKAAFFDDNTQSMWTPTVAGSNVPALNELLGRFGLGLGDSVYEGKLPADVFVDDNLVFDSGNAVVRAPKGADLVHAELKMRDTTTSAAKSLRRRGSSAVVGSTTARVPVLAVHERVAVFTDSGCLDDAHHLGGYCWTLVDRVLDRIVHNATNATNFFDTRLESTLHSAPPADDPPSPLLAKYSQRFRRTVESPLLSSFFFDRHQDAHLRCSPSSQ